MKTARLKKIVDIIEHNSVCRQEELRALLAKEGYPCTQATLSRDLSELGVHKIRDGGMLRYTVQKPIAPPIFAAGIRSVRLAVNIVVIVCEPGSAGAVCVQLDSMDADEVVGTIAGDDTIFVACESSEAAKRFSLRVENLLRKTNT
jgi:transcriptional regulator of arginine metabolism